MVDTRPCKVDVAVEGVTFPRHARREPVSVPADLAPRLELRFGATERVVTPRGWRCSVLAATNGGTALTTAPAEAGAASGMRTWTEPACVGCIYEATCRYFRTAARPLSVGLPCGRKPVFRHVWRLSPELVRYRDDDGEIGLVALRPDEPWAAGISCLSAAPRICEAALADWRGWRGL